MGVYRAYNIQTPHSQEVRTIHNSIANEKATHTGIVPFCVVTILKAFKNVLYEVLSFSNALFCEIVGKCRIFPNVFIKNFIELIKYR